jgi:hypothetical protein
MRLPEEVRAARSDVSFQNLVVTPKNNLDVAEKHGFFLFANAGHGLREEPFP